MGLTRPRRRVTPLNPRPSCRQSSTDNIHVLEYLRKAAWCFCPPRDPAAEDWVTAQVLSGAQHSDVGEVLRR
jgi:hypothetical protein